MNDTEYKVLMIDDDELRAADSILPCDHIPFERSSVLIMQKIFY